MILPSWMGRFFYAVKGDKTWITTAITAAEWAALDFCSAAGSGIYYYENCRRDRMELGMGACAHLDIWGACTVHSGYRFDYCFLGKEVTSSCIIVSSKDQRETEAEYYRNILGFVNDFIYAETQEEARLMVIDNRGFLPVEAVGKLPEVSGAIRRVPLYHRNRRVTRKYCLFWLEERTGYYYIEEFAEMLRKRLS